MRNAYRVAVHKPEGKTPIGRPWRGWESNVTVDLKRNRLEERGME
jgi:hypothetical protein